MPRTPTATVLRLSFLAACEEITAHSVEGSRPLTDAECAVVLKLAPGVTTEHPVEGIKFFNGDILLSYVPLHPDAGHQGLRFLLFRMTP